LESGDDDVQFYRIGSRLVILASCPLAATIAADIAVVLFKITECSLTSGLIAVASFCFRRGMARLSGLGTNGIKGGIEGVIYG